MTAPRLVQPDAAYAESHASFVAEMLARGEQLVPWVLAEVGDDFEAYVKRLRQQAEGRQLPAGFVPSSTFWLLDGVEEIVAVSNLRHRLNEFLSSYGGHIGFGVRPSARRRGYATEVLRQTVVAARELGIGSVLVTCDKGNVGSARAILRNGGEFSEEEYLREHGCTIQRYWIHAD